MQKKTGIGQAHALLKQNIIGHAGHTPDGIDKVMTFFKEQSAKRGTILLNQGEICKTVYFVAEGCLQVFVTDAEGKESTRELYIEEQWVTDIFGFQNQTPSSENIRCAEPCLLLTISYSDFAQLSKEYGAFTDVYKKILEASYNNTVFRINSLMALDGLDRLRWLRENKPKLMSRLSNRLIASYLGLSPETVTRLKAKL